MSKKKAFKMPTDIVSTLVEGWTSKEIIALAEFKRDGLPGITKFSEELITKAKNAYLNGKPFSMISMELRIPKGVLTYYAYKDAWQSARMERMNTIVESLTSQLPIMHVDNALFATEMADVIKRYYRERIELYNKTKDDQVIANTDWKLFTNFTKILETLRGTTPNSPPVNITAQEGSVVNVKGGSEDVQDLGSVLKTLADANRSKDTK